MKLTWAVHAYAWTSHWTDDDLGVIDRARGLGLDAVEIPLMDLEDVHPGAIAARASEQGRRLVTSTVCAAATDPCSPDDAVRQAARDYLRACVDAAAEMGAPLLSGVLYAHHGGRIDALPERVLYERSAEVLRDVARYAAGRGVTLGLEPCNRYETYLLNTAEQALDLVGLIGEDNVGVHLDAYHMNIEEEDFATPVERVGERLVHLHLSESHRGTPGTGTVDWGALMGALERIGYEGFAGLESFEEIAPSMRAATCVWRQMAESSDALVARGLAHLKGLVPA